MTELTIDSASPISDISDKFPSTPKSPNVYTPKALSSRNRQKSFDIQEEVKLQEDAFYWESRLTPRQELHTAPTALSPKQSKTVRTKERNKKQEEETLKLVCRSNGQVKEILDCFWHLCPSSRTEFGLSETEFIRVYCMVSKAVRRHFSMELATQAAQTEWDLDMCRQNEEFTHKMAQYGISLAAKIGSPTGMTQKGFHDIMLKFADHFLDEYSLVNHIKFFRTLHARITRPISWSPEDGVEKPNISQYEEYMWRGIGDVTTAHHFKHEDDKNVYTITNTETEEHDDDDDGDDDDDIVTEEPHHVKSLDARLKSYRVDAGLEIEENMYPIPIPLDLTTTTTINDDDTEPMTDRDGIWFKYKDPQLHHDKPKRKKKFTSPVHHRGNIDTKQHGWEARSLSKYGLEPDSMLLKEPVSISSSSSSSILLTRAVDETPPISASSPYRPSRRLTRRLDMLSAPLSPPSIKIIMRKGSIQNSQSVPTLEKQKYPLEYNFTSFSKSRPPTREFQNVRRICETAPISKIKQRLTSFRLAQRELLEKKKGSIEQLYLLPSLPNARPAKTTHWYHAPEDFEGFRRSRPASAAVVIEEEVDISTKMDKSKSMASLGKKKAKKTKSKKKL